MEAARIYSRDELENKKYAELQKISKALGIKGGRLKTDKLIEAIIEAEASSDFLSEDAGNIATALAEAAVKEDDSIDHMETHVLKATPLEGRGGSADVVPRMNGSSGNINGSSMKTFSPNTSTYEESSTDSLQHPDSPSKLMGNLSLNEKMGPESPKKERVKRKKVLGDKNLFVGRMVQPKNAVMCLNDLCPKAVYTNGQRVGVSFCIAVEVFGKIYHGYGSSKEVAKQVAAEAALVSFVQSSPDSISLRNKRIENYSDKENAVNNESKVESNQNAVSEGLLSVDNSSETDLQGGIKYRSNHGKQQVTDGTPWATIASFALHKLFHNWYEGRVGECRQLPPYGIHFGTSVMSTHRGASLVIPDARKQNVFFQMGTSQSLGHVSRTAFEAITAHLSGNASGTATVGSPGKVPQPAKQLPEDAQNMHPVMLLHQMRPQVKYNVANSTQDNKPYFILTSEIDGQTFTGEGLRVKKAKYFLAKEAIEKLFGVYTTTV